MTARRLARGSFFLALMLIMSISLTGCNPGAIIAIIGAIAEGVSKILDSVANIVSAATGNEPGNAGEGQTAAPPAAEPGTAQPPAANPPANTPAANPTPVLKAPPMPTTLLGVPLDKISAPKPPAATPAPLPPGTTKVGNFTVPTQFAPKGSTLKGTTVPAPEGEGK